MNIYIKLIIIIGIIYFIFFYKKKLKENFLNYDDNNEYNYLGPIWKDEFNYNNFELLKIKYKRDKILESIKN